MRIRKLTPKECLTLMGFDEEDYKAMRKAGMTDSQIYHCSGDAIVVPVLMSLFGSLMPITEKELHKKMNNYIDSLVVK